MISSWGVEANSDKIQAVLDMKPPCNIRELQQLSWCITALGHFMSRSANKCQPFVCFLRRGTHSVWDEEAYEAFQALRTYLAHLPKIASPLPGETLLFYLVVSE